MIREFSGKTEEEAVDLAIAELNLDRSAFDVEVLENQKGGLFKKGSVRIRVHLHDDGGTTAPVEAESDFEKAACEFVTGIIQRMGYEAKVGVGRRQEQKLHLVIESDHSGILIGKKGKNLDALQVLANVFAGKSDQSTRIIIDAENYRSRREESLIRLAKKTAEQVKRNKSSRLLEPMNPFERRLVHTTLNEIEDVETISEGDGLYKQIRVLYRGSAH